MLYAARNLPKDHTLLLVHGVHSWMGSSISETDKPDILELEDHYESLCKKAGRDCKFKHFSYTTTSGFGDEVCSVRRNPYPLHIWRYHKRTQRTPYNTDCGQEGRGVCGDRPPRERVWHEKVRAAQHRVVIVPLVH
jgi:hypothetical protein